MSHSKIRKEKDCLNCGAETLGRYCSNCGQENIEPKQTVWHLITHFFSDITHFDGKFFTTVKDLFAKPGFLSREYMMGRRISYLDPIRMYIFTSAIFFLIFFAIFNVESLQVGTGTLNEIKKDPDLQELLSKVSTSKDSLRIIEKYNEPETKYVNVASDSIKGGKSKITANLAGIKYNSIKEYEFGQKLLPPAERDGWLKRKIKHKTIELNQRYAKESGGLIREMFGKFLHNSPKVLFISLPIFALLLKGLYVRRKQFYYVDHGIFAIHLYIFTFLVLLVWFGINELKKDTGWSVLTWVEFLIFLYPFFYYYKAMRRFYGQSRAKTFLKYSLLLVFSLILQIFIFTAALIFSVAET